MSLPSWEGETHIGTTSMHTTASNNLVLTSFSSFKPLTDLENQVSHGGLYQGMAYTLIKGIHINQVLSNLATKLASIADHAYSIRRFDIVRWVGGALLNLPLGRQLEGVGDYYRALGLNESGCGDVALAGSLFEQAADEAPLRYRARAILALGGRSLASCDHQTARSFYGEVMRIVRREHIFDPVSFCVAGRMTAVVRSIEGDHRGAVLGLESMLPLARLARSVQPCAYYDYLNTLAVELCEVGRLEEARNASRIALASPFAAAYPEWRETREEIDLRGYHASRSNVPVSKRSLDNLMRLPAREPVDSLASGSFLPIQPARVLSFLEGKKKMVKESNGPPEEKKNYEDMDGKEMLLKIMELTASSDRTDYELYQILRAIEAVVSKPKEPNKQ